MGLIRSKKTLYNEILFRSELEAKWAVFFDYLYIAYKYEPEWDEVDIGIGYVRYKPDFYLPDIDLWIEVKPVAFKSMQYGDTKKAEGWARDYGELLVLAGPPSVPRETTKAHYLLTWYELCIPMNSATCSEGFRPPVPNHSGHLFRYKSAS